MHDVEAVISSRVERFWCLQVRAIEGEMEGAQKLDVQRESSRLKSQQEVRQRSCTSRVYCVAMSAAPPAARFGPSTSDVASDCP